MGRRVGPTGVAALFFLTTIASILVVAPGSVTGAPGVDYVVVTDGPGGTGSWVSGRSYLFADTDVFFAAGYNLTSGYVADVPAYWGAQPGGNSTVPRVLMNVTYGTSVTLRAVGAGSTRVQAAHYEGGNRTLANWTGTLQVSAENVDSVVIRTDYDGGGTWVGDTRYRVSETDLFHAAAYNATTGYLGDIVSSWASTDPTVGVVNETYGWQDLVHWDDPVGVFSAVGGGVTYVTAAPGGTPVSNTTGALEVLSVDRIVVTDGPNGTGSWVSYRDYAFGDSDRFWAAAYNDTYGWVADVHAYWSTGADPTGGGSDGRVIRTDVPWGPTVRIDTNGYGVTTLNVTYYGPDRGALWNRTGPLSVSVDNVDAVVIRTDRGGSGTWVGDTLYDLGDTDIFYAAAYNATVGFLGDIVSNWTSSNVSVGYVWPSGNQTQGCYPGTAYPCYPSVQFRTVGLGFTYVGATPVGTNLTNSTGKLTVTTITTDYVQVRDGPHGGGTVLGPRTYYPGEQDTYYAASYNRTIGYLGDVVSDWTSNNTASCEVKSYYGGTAHGSSVQLLLKAPGLCTVTVTASTPTGLVTNVTGTLSVLPRTLITVDDDGPADFSKIQDAVDAASDGTKILVKPGTYPENVVVRKEVEIVGETRGTAVLDGQGGAIALLLDADRIVVHNLTVSNAAVAVFQEHTNNTRFYDNTVSDYGTGLYHNRTLNAWVAYNTVTRGSIGVLTNESYDDAIRWNVISYNTVYGAKSYNTRLRNCFNWNTFHHNRVAYFHDPTTEYPPMEFDGNVITDNEVGVRVENASSIRLTNNTFSGGLTGLELLNSSAEARWNTFAGLGTAILCRASGSNLTDNAIAALDAGVVCDGGAPRIEGNDIRAVSGRAIELANMDGAIVRGNDLHGGLLRVTDSRLAVLAPVNSTVVLQDTTWDAEVLDGTSTVEVRWLVTVRALDWDGAPLGGYTVIVRDASRAVAFQGTTGPDGLTPAFPLVSRRYASGWIDADAYAVEVLGERGSVARAVTVTASETFDVALAAPIPPARPWAPDPFVVGFLVLATAASTALTAAFAVERSRYALLALLVPLFSRIRRDEVLENYNRGRVFEYIELNPGVHFNGILAALGLNNGNLVYHLEVLRKEGLVTSRQEGMFRRFYPSDVRPPPLLENGTTEAQTRVLKAIEEMPGITQKELARFLGLRQSTLAYQIDRLAAMGYIAGERRGRAVHYTARKGGN